MLRPRHAASARTLPHRNRATPTRALRRRLTALNPPRRRSNTEKHLP